MQHMNNGDNQKENIRKAAGPMDMQFAMLVALIGGIGLVMMFSASYAWGAANPRLGPAFYVTRQSGYMVMGLAIMLLTSRINYQYLRGLSFAAVGISVVLLIVVLFVGSADKGAIRWIHIGEINIQPSEIAKVAVIMMFATLLSGRNERLVPKDKGLKESIIDLAPYIALLAGITGLIALQPHFSAMILILAVGAVMLFMGGIPYRWIAVVGGLGVSVMFILINFTQYASARIGIWRDPLSDPQGGGYQTMQSLYAVASGGWFGRGLGQSAQKHLYLPEPHNDFVFAIVCEELGLIGALIVLFLFMLLILRGYYIALKARESFGRLLVAGITTLLAIQVVLNVAVVTNFVPVTGIPMPFFSYGGSSLVILMAQMGIVLSVSRQMRV
jgi:cell division protein FtsW